MTHRQRRKYYQKWSMFQQKQEQIWLPRVLAVLNKYSTGFAEYARNNGLNEAVGRINEIITAEPLYKVLSNLYRIVGIKSGQKIKQAIKSYSQKLLTMGFNEQLTADILEYFRLYILNKAVIPITETQKKAILTAVEEGIVEGLDLDQIIKRIEDNPYTVYHARLVVRTETVRAANAGGELAAKRSRLQLDKEWISAHDSRVRRPPKSKFDHWHLDGQIVAEDGSFISGGEALRFPGDPAGSAGNVVQCRCTTAYIPKRDANGRLIRKPDGGQFQTFTL